MSTVRLDHAPPRAIIFDLSEVLIAGIVGVEHRLAGRLRRSPDTIARVLQGPILQSLMLDKISESDYLRRAIAAGRWNVDESILSRAIQDNFDVAFQDSIDLLPILARNFRLYLHSDHAREWIQYIRRRHDFFDLFEQTFFSYEIYATKRQVAAYHHVLDEIRIEPSDCLFVDDSAVNIAVAKTVGLRTHLFTSAEGVMQEVSGRIVSTNLV